VNDTKDKATDKLNASRPYLRTVRYIFQWSLVLIILMSGYSLYEFHRRLSVGDLPDFSKPLAVEGFMPIGALMSLKLWITKGIFDPVHPAALVIFITALLLALLLKKGFCGWVCPVGTISEIVWKTGKKIFGKNVILPRSVDYPLRSLKYLLMAFFLYIIVIKMSPDAIHAFLYTPYWKVADLKLLVFFTDMSTTTLVVLLTLTVFSLLIKNAWCRYLCPYGALLGLISMLSPLKITRNEDACIHCKTCTQSCPSMLPVESKERISSPECIGCLTCVSKCPAHGALDVALVSKKRINPLVHVALVIILFWGSVVFARAVNHWNTGITNAEYVKIVPFLERLEHP
jgi:polyferredoxin